MRRLFAWTAGVVGIAALARLLARARRPEPKPEPWTPAGDERAEALRRKLSETRATVEAPAPGHDVTLASATAEAHGAEREDAPGRPSESIEERRARVHAKAQEAIDAMQEALE
ncbi:hypothetical protein [Gaiella sp.]|uniref:hypothetical protein n=1 Tax=Gaiella sp. TaxID=2663207 RepID=UPI002E341B14|nr:hypothetical protein [Gaiella sp.]HEX5584519.1 hypothetical protein [Gaiella sp.]